MNEHEKSILIVDDEPDIQESLSIIFESEGFSVKTASTGAEAIESFSHEPVPVIVCDNSLPDAQGVDLLREFRVILPEVQMIMLTGKGTIDIAVAAMKAGFFDFVTKPVEPEHLVQLVIRAHQLYDAITQKITLQEAVERITEQSIIGKNAVMNSMIRLIYTVAPTDSTVLLEGESGTGKELVARLIHQKSQRSAEPFVAVDCGAIPDGLVESELFGHDKGAFTGAIAARPGKFERANKGTLFLDEISNLPLMSQAKLLRTLQEKVIERVGGQRQIPVNIRLIAASNTELQQALREGTFREDLYYRLNIVKIVIPPLRERRSDILLLAQHFIKKHRERINSTAGSLSNETLRILMDYDWPGNVRELENTIEHALIMSRNTQIMPRDLPALDMLDRTPKHSNGPIPKLLEAEKNLILRALNDTGGNKYKAAKILGIPRSSLYSKLKKLDINNV